MDSKEEQEHVDDIHKYIVYLHIKYMCIYISLDIDEGRGCAIKLSVVITFVNKSALETSLFHDSFFIYADQHVELTLQYVLLTIYIFADQHVELTLQYVLLTIYMYIYNQAISLFDVVFESTLLNCANPCRNWTFQRFARVAEKKERNGTNKESDSR